MTKHAFFLLACVLALFLVSCEKDDNNNGDQSDQAAIVAELAGEYSGRYALTVNITATTSLGVSVPLSLPSLSTPSGTTKAATITATVDPDNTNKLKTVASLSDVDFMQALNPAYENDTYTFTNNLENFTKRDGNITGYSVQNTEGLPLITTEKVVVGGNSVPMVLSNISATNISGLNATFSGGLEVSRVQAAMLFPAIASAPSEISNIAINFNIVLSDMSKQ